jgi:hypothetical protein
MFLDQFDVRIKKTYLIITDPSHLCLSFLNVIPLKSIMFLIIVFEVFSWCIAACYVNVNQVAKRRLQINPSTCISIQKYMYIVFCISHLSQLARDEKASQINR